MLDLLIAPILFLVGFIYPAIESFKAIGTPGKDDDKQWLTYWVVYAFVTTVEPFAAVFLSYFALYPFVKLGLIVYLSIFGGATLIFDNVIVYFVDSQRDNFFVALDKLKEAGLDIDALKEMGEAELAKLKEKVGAATKKEE